jgi:4-hydroxy-tetrahydrodipicolinate synthase
MNGGRFKGILVPVLTPFNGDLSPDPKRFERICKWLLNNGAHGLAPFGTTSESNSMSTGERMMMLEHVVKSGIDPRKIMPGVGCCSLSDNVQLANHATEMGCEAVLMLPPFFYKNVDDDGIFWMFEETIKQLTDKSLQIYLYHIPPQTIKGIGLDLIKRLVAAFPENIVGVKDSSGDWKNTRAIIENVPDFTVFPGSEPFLLQGLRAGAAGCITASGNVNPTDIRRVYDNWQSGDADRLQEKITLVRNVLQNYPMIPALKKVIAHFSGDDSWVQTRPPLPVLGREQGASLIADLNNLEWSPPNVEDLCCL